MTIKRETCEVYVAQDGRRFNDEEECAAYEAKLTRANGFNALKEKVDAIECIENSYAPFGYGFVDDERYEYRWYRPKNYEEVMALNTFFNVAVEQDDTIADVIGEWVGVEIDGGYDAYTGEEDTYDMPKIVLANENLVKFYAELGYDVKIRKQESAIAARDKALEELWKCFAEVPVNPKTDTICETFIHFPAGTKKEDIWHWFDERHSKGVAYLLHGENAKGENV